MFYSFHLPPLFSHFFPFTQSPLSPTFPLLKETLDLSSRKPTFTRYIRRHRPPIAKPYSRDLALRRIRFFRLHRADFQANSLHMRPVHERGGDCVTGAFRDAGIAQNLHKSCGEGPSRGEMASVEVMVGIGVGDGGGVEEAGEDAKNGI